MHILMVAAENGAIPGGKVGGIGDVLRDLPLALAGLGHDVSVVTPAYGRFHQATGVVQEHNIAAPFGNSTESVAVFRLPGAKKGKHVETYVLEHPLFSRCGRGAIYCDDPPHEPFSRDSEKFALFSAAVAAGMSDGAFGDVDVLHLHDWHAATVAALLRLHPQYRALAKFKIVFTIHNLALQGIRPLHGGPATLLSWFPDLPLSPHLVDPRYADCYNPLRAALLFSDRVNSVSPTYVEEICDSSRDMGEGLAKDLAALRASGRLHGILNGCEYPKTLPPALPRPEFLELLREVVLGWMSQEPTVRSAHMLALERLREPLRNGQAPELTVTAIGRLTDQKLGLITEIMPDGRPALDHMLDLLSEDEELLVLGSGQEDLENFLVRTAGENRKLLFLRGYSDQVSSQLYSLGGLFLMPSLFEPCGIAQMLAMRAGQPCLVNHTGGLADTVTDEVNGFVFSGDNRAELATAMIGRMRQALTKIRHHKRKHATLRENARQARFRWSDSAQAYVEQLYS